MGWGWGVGGRRGGMGGCGRGVRQADERGRRQGAGGLGASRVRPRGGVGAHRAVGGHGAVQLLALDVVAGGRGWGRGRGRGREAARNWWSPLPLCRFTPPSGIPGPSSLQTSSPPLPPAPPPTPHLCLVCAMMSLTSSKCTVQLSTLLRRSQMTFVWGWGVGGGGWGVGGGGWGVAAAQQQERSGGAGGWRVERARRGVGHRVGHHAAQPGRAAGTGRGARRTGRMPKASHSLKEGSRTLSRIVSAWPAGGGGCGGWGGVGAALGGVGAAGQACGRGGRRLPRGS
jgi:hypothetical protein